MFKFTLISFNLILSIFIYEALLLVAVNGNDNPDEKNSTLLQLQRNKTDPGAIADGDDNNFGIIETTTVQLLVGNSMNLPNDTNNKENGLQPAAGVKNEPEVSGVFTYLKAVFKPKPALGENCTLQGDCEIQESLCLEGTCECSQGYVASIDRTRCLKTVNSLGDFCNEDAQCYKGLNLKEGDVLCISFRCVCSSGTRYHNGTCIKTMFLGNKCQSDVECLTENSLCLQEVCACPINQIPSADEKRCLPLLKSIGSSNCTEDAQCQQLMGDMALCNHQVEECQCKPKSHSNGTMCLTDLKLGDECKEPNDCISSEEINVINRRDCVDGRCVCATGFNQIDGENLCINSANSLSNNYLFINLILIIVFNLFK